MNFSKQVTLAALQAFLVVPHVRAACPFAKEQNTRYDFNRRLDATNVREGDGGVPDAGFGAVKEDIKRVLADSQDFFPADSGNYGPFMIRLAWHCSGSYRESDGRGGCDGGRIRFDPELNWPDNANLQNALKILEPVKEKFGSKLSWGDLIILAGNTAIESMGGPILGFCGGRIDDSNGSNSLVLGPSEEQEILSPCLKQGACLDVTSRANALGPTTVGLIYVNPRGPVGEQGIPSASGHDIRKAFENMGFSDTETVSLIGGGHAFGKCHGACADPPCGAGTDMEGIGPNTFTSGFEGPWTTRPTTWSNDYFNNLFDFEWNVIDGPGGNIQWEPTNSDGSPAPDIMMLTTDIALSKDEKYKAISQEYASDLELLEKDFMHSWYRLTTSDMGPVSRCIGDNVPPAQLFQVPLDMAKESTIEPNYVPVRANIQEILDQDTANGPSFVNLAYRCSSTYRDTDYKGGCNGARIRFSPESEWESNKGTAEALATLAPVKEMFPAVSMSDIIVLAGQTALEDVGSKYMAFCGGRMDADHADDSEVLAPRTYTPVLVSIKDDMQVKGLTAREGVALAGRPTNPSDTFTNKFYTDLMANRDQFSEEEQALLDDADFAKIVAEYAGSEEVFLADFATAWTKMMTADRFDGPTNNACTNVDHSTLEEVKSPGDDKIEAVDDKPEAVDDKPAAVNEKPADAENSGHVVSGMFALILPIAGASMVSLL